MTDDTRLTDALGTFLSEVRRLGPDRARDIVSAWRDDENDGEDETTLNPALCHQIDEALMIAAEIDEDVTRSITIRDWTRGASRLHFSWAESRLNAGLEYRAAIHSLVESTLGPDPILQLAFEVAAEVRRAETKHEPLNSPHEAWSVIYEELEELREHVRGDTGRSDAAREEALQVAAMGLRYVLNLVAEPTP